MAVTKVSPKYESCKSPLTAERVRELFQYEPETGLLTWLVKPAHWVKVGDAAGWDNGNGYLRVSVFSEKFYVHDLAWLWMTGGWPEPQCDHIDADRKNNRWANLRVATLQENRRNHGKGWGNSSGLKWITKHHGGWQWVVRAEKTALRGWSMSPVAAHLQAVVAADQLHGSFSRSK